MAYEKLFNLLGDNKKLISLITNISSGYLDIPYIMINTLSILDDTSQFYNFISDGDKKALCIMLDQYFIDCYSIYIDSKDLNKLIEYGKIEIYKVEAANGLRYATTNEVAQGIRGLLPENIYPAGEDEYKKLCLLYWTFTGKNYYLRQAGYNLEYDQDGNVLNTFFEIIQMIAYGLKDLFAWVSINNNITSSLKKLEKMKKSRGYKYASFEKDEIDEDITIKQLVYNVYNVFPRNSINKNYRKGLALAIKSYKGNKDLTPYEVSTLRDIYNEYALDKSSRSGISEESQKLRELCTRLTNERYSGKINPKHFCYKIIDSLKKSNYIRCSAKQYAILEDAINILDRVPEDDVDTGEEIVKTQIISDVDIDSSLESLSNALGQGLFEDD